MKAYLINNPEEYQGQKLNDSTYFNPFQDKDGRWRLSIEDVQQAGITGLELVEFEPIPPQNFDIF